MLRNVKVWLENRDYAQSMHFLETKKPPHLWGLDFTGGLDGTRTRDPLRDRQILIEFIWIKNPINTGVFSD